MMNFEFLKGKKGFRMLAQFTSDAETFAVSLSAQQLIFRQTFCTDNYFPYICTNINILSHEQL